MRRSLTLAALIAPLAALTACASVTGTAASNDKATSSPSAAVTLSMADKVTAWSVSGGSALLNAFAADAKTIQAAVKKSDWAAVSAGCTQFGADVTKAQAYKPIPDAETQAHWSQSLTDYQEGAQDCTTATATMDTDLLSQSMSEIGAGTAELGAATTSIGKLSQ